MYLGNLAHIHLALGVVARARPQFEESLAMCRTTGSDLGSAYMLSGLGGVAVAEGDARRGVLLLAAAESAFERIGITMQLTDREAHDRCIQQARRRLPAGTFEEAWRDGRALALDAAVGLAIGTRESA